MSPQLTSVSRQRSTSGSPAADSTRPAVSIGLVLAICLVAAAGPRLLGVLHDTTGSRTLPLMVLAVLGFAMAGAGYGAGQNRQVCCSAR